MMPGIGSSDNLPKGRGGTETDGAELTLFVWREFCECLQPPPIEGPTVPEAIALLRKAMHLRLRAV
ncbi:hypothetical protein GA0061100_106446 [Rhizobium hainanense]|uniref:Uncharacterized protein n=1 Tax=Rhizobium hainanense TaxID=52131 RepID=A0A1C3VLN2_9HYPH|nr:hypothetical protein GA0061100_106446 [Rhizobium hainanense]